ncbi:imelysin family protein [Peredibacter sp. HCB2-198]|uniref:imelysin family protein n=1 Tax=Peredibacter sp. HCB2-198 TaxID=3383025 RepID=UPI0038B63FF8
MISSKNLVLAFSLVLSAPAFTQTTLKESIQSYSEHVHSSYAETLRRGVLLQKALHAFTETPSLMTQTVAKETWKYAREAYGQTEVFRFYNGPIDRDGGPEGLLNSWPLDEAYIDYVKGAPNAGIINNTTEFPEITKELLESLNELDGEKNISTGYHAIEFLLWGQDFYTDGPGLRSYTDYVDAPNAARRALYLNTIADMLVDHLASLETEWRAGEENFRKDFESQKDTAALKNLLSGVIFMAGDELSGERMYVAYDTQGQEDEHSCFSDMTHMDIQWNYWGIENVIKATNLLNQPEVKGTPVAQRIEKRMTELRALLATIPVPFDQAIANDEGRAIILNSVEELEALARDLATVSKMLKASVDY